MRPTTRDQRDAVARAAVASRPVERPAPVRRMRRLGTILDHGPEDLLVLGVLIPHLTPHPAHPPATTSQRALDANRDD